jgi:hypothetical protein
VRVVPERRDAEADAAVCVLAGTPALARAGALDAAASGEPAGASRRAAAIPQTLQ